MSRKAAFGASAWWFGAAVLAAAGCHRPAEPIGKVSGHVTYHGKPLPEGTIVFVKAGGGVAVTAPIHADGSYAVQTPKGAGLPPGEYQAAVQPARDVVAPGDVRLAGDAPKREDRPDDPPKKYRDPSASGLKAAVKEGDNPPFDFDLDKS